MYVNNIPQVSLCLRARREHASGLKRASPFRPRRRSEEQESPAGLEQVKKDSPKNGSTDANDPPLDSLS